MAVRRRMSVVDGPCAHRNNEHLEEEQSFGPPGRSLEVLNRRRNNFGWSTAPIPESEASQPSESSAFGLGWSNVVGACSADLHLLKASSASVVNTFRSFFLFVDGMRLTKGRRISAAWGMHCL